MIFEHIKVGITSVRGSRFRSFFTMLGVIIGVVSVVTIMSIGEGVKRQITGQVADLGTNLISVRPGKVIERDQSGKIKNINLFSSTGIASLTQKDVASIKKIPGIESVVALSTFSGLPSYNGEQYKDGVLVASSPNLTSVIDHKIEFGTFISPEEVSTKSVVIGSKVSERLFKEAVPLGKSLNIRGQNFTVQGVFGSFTEVPISTGIDLNNAVFLSDVMARQINGADTPIYEILTKHVAKADDSALVSKIDSVLTQNHGGQTDFTVFSQNESGAASDELLKILTKMILGMAGITLLIGGVGIMNVMLVSVSERKREIGIRKAVGASDSQIRNQFILESAILSVWGAIFGIIISAILNVVLRIVTDLEPVLQWQPILFVSLISVAIGMLFGSVPAIKASKKDPIESFRS